MRGDEFFLLFFIAKKSDLSGSFSSSTAGIAFKLNISQQSVSRKLRKLESLNLISRMVSPLGCRLSLTDSGKNFLKQYFLELKHLFERPLTKSLTGAVESGCGEGSYYLSLPKYRKQLQELLGFVLFTGTLNLKVNESELDNFLFDQNSFLVDGFETKQRTFGSLKCFKVKVNDSVDAALIFPERSSHSSEIAEVVAGVNLRKKFSLNDGGEVKLSL